MRRWFLCLMLVACKGEPEVAPHTYDGLLDLGRHNPYPNHLLIEDGHVALSDDMLPAGVAHPDFERVAWRTGFSPAQTSVLHLPNIDPSNFPTFLDIRVGEGSVRLVDLDTGAFLPVMAELDAWPEAVNPSLLIRPLKTLPLDHRIGVAVLTDAVARPQSFDDLLFDAPAGNEALASHAQELVAKLGEAGIAQDDIAVAWDFPVAQAVTPLTSALSQTSFDGEVSITRVRNLDAGDTLPPHVWRSAEGTYTVTDFLVDDLTLDLQADGTVSPVGTAEAELFVIVPNSVADAPEGSVPVLVFGHGIFSAPELYLDLNDDPSNVLALAEELGAIVVGTTWRGLTLSDSVEVLQAASDFSLFATVPERLVQGQVNTRTLAEMAASGHLLENPIFLGASGQSLPNPDHVVYYGISLGSIEGAVMLANDPPFDAVVLHVGGGFWSTMLERSSNWSTFELLMEDGVPNPEDRQLLYAISQLWWDPVDPASYVDALSQKDVLYQYSLGDEQVANLTTEALIRSIDLPMLGPTADTLVGIPETTEPVRRAAVQFDPERVAPPPTNRPAEVNGAHHAPRMWGGAQSQVVDYLSAETLGEIVHHCGAVVCSESNRGE